MWANLNGRPLEIQSSSGDTDTTTRALYGLEAMPVGNLRTLHELWRERCARRRCGFPTIDDMAEYPAVTADCHLIDVSQPNPWVFRILSYGAPSAASRGSNYCGMHLGEVPSLLHSSGLQVDYNTVKMLGVPRLQAISTRYDHRSRAYARLIMPVSQSGGPIDRLIVAVSIVVEADNFSALSAISSTA